jgi:hypothetical protein
MRIRRVSSRMVGAFPAAARGGDLAALVSLLDPQVVLRADAGVLAGGLRVVRGVAAVSGQLGTFHRMAPAAPARPALVDGLAGLVASVDGWVVSVLGFTVAEGRIAAIDIWSDPGRPARLGLA